MRKLGPRLKNVASSNKSDMIGVIRTAAPSFGFNLKHEQESALKEFV